MSVPEGAPFVGFAPEAHPRSYESHSVWDVGFLAAEGDTLVYYGDKTRFSISRAKVTGVRRGRSFPSWIPVPETYVSWSDGSEERLFHVHSLEGSSLITVAAASKSLLVNLINWHQEGRWSGEERAESPAPPLPGLFEVQGLVPGRSGTMKSYITFSLFLAIATLGLSRLVGLDGLHAWYAFALSLCTTSVSIIPVFRYKDEP